MGRIPKSEKLNALQKQNRDENADVETNGKFKEKKQKS